MKTKMMNIVLTICFLGSLSLSGQIKQANNYFEQFKYSKAIPVFKKMTTDKDLKIRKAASVGLADCYRLMNNAVEANVWYAKVVEFGDVSPENYFYLGTALRSLALYDEAEKAFNKYVKKNPSDFRGKIYAQYCRDIKEWDGLAPCAELKNASGINSPYSDFGAMFFKNGVIFTSDRDNSLRIDKNYRCKNSGCLRLYSAQPLVNSDFWTSLADPVKMPNSFCQAHHDGSASFMGKKIIYNPLSFNSEDYSVGHPAISGDGKKLIFSSDKPGSLGGSDLYVSELIDGKWSNPVSLGAEVNTFGNEVFPFLANDSTLFFSSDGHPGYGGLDVYQTELVHGKWTTPWNLKRPINTPYDDFSIAFSKSLTDGFVSSNRPGGKGSDDIYVFRNYKRTPMVEVKPVIPENIMASIGGYVNDKITQAPIDPATAFLVNSRPNSPVDNGSFGSTAPTISTISAGDKILFAVQVAASTCSIKIIPKDSKSRQVIHEKKIGSVYKYFSASFDNLNQASAEKKKLQEKFPGAFIVAFKGGEPIPLSRIQKN